MSESKTIVFAIPGAEDSTRAGRAELSGRESADFVKLEATPGDLVELEIVNGPKLILHPERASQLFLAQQAPKRSSGSDVVVPMRLAWSTAELDRARGGGPRELGQVVLRAFKVVKATVESKGANWVAPRVGEAVDARVATGLRRVLKLTDLEQPPQQPEASKKPLLVLLHGTFNTTAESFGRLWDQPGLFASLNEAFDVYAFDHPTLTQSPLKNALELAKLLPVGAEVSFLTYSRGGLVAEVLSQLASGKATDNSCFDEAKYAALREELNELVSVLSARKLTVKRIVRVACPARGTLLASERLDVYFSILKWGLELAQIPVAPTVVEFIHEIAKRRTKPDELPGLECMMPESGFIRWLNQPAAEIDGELFVVAGDLQADSLSSWLKMLVSDSFFWTDNDLIVQTRSMYAGRPRTGGSRYLLDRGGKVNHFNYCSNRATVQAMQRALLEPKPSDFQVIGRLSSEGISSTGARAAVSDLSAVLERSKSKDKPAVIILPGILGSQLRVDGELVWLSLRIVNGLERLRYAENDASVAPGGWISLYYDELARYLATSHEVIQFPFDWRKPIEVEAKRLADVIDDTLKDRTAPVRILAHSLGGLVARAVQKEAKGVWDKLFKHEQSRLIMMGTPHAGSWAPMQVLSGDNLVGNLVAYLGALFREQEARELFAALPGFIQLQAGLLDAALGLDKPETWQALANADRKLWELSTPWHNLEIQRRNLNWGLPKKDVLEKARELQAWLALQDLQPYGNRIVNVVGNADETPSGYVTDPTAQSFDYLQTSRGDGTVTLSSAMLRGVRAFQVDVEHSRLPASSELFAGYLNLLETGTPDDSRFTSLLSMRAAQATSIETSARAPRRVARLRGWSDDELEAVEGTLTLPSAPPPVASRASAPALKIAVVNGDLTFVNQPLLLGHYRSLALTGAEGVMDRFLGGSMTRGLLLRGYATLPGEAKVFDNHQKNDDEPHAVPRPPAVVVVGLGAEGELRAEDLITTVRQGVIEYVRSRGNDAKQPSSFELATVLIGSGGIGIAVATAARAVAQGVHAANERLLEQNAPVVSALHFIELYEDRACEALRELLAVADQKPACFEVEPWLKTGSKPLRRPLTSGYRGANYDMVSVLDGPSRDGKRSIAFTIDTRRARTEVRSTTTQLPLLQALIDQAQDDRQGETKLGKSLFRMLVPPELDSFFGGSEAVLLQLDAATAGVPWELLSVDTDDQSSDTPWSIRAKLLRKLHTAEFREHPQPSGPEAKVLVIGDPHVDDRSQYRPLPGAQREAQVVAEVFGVQALIDPSAVDTVNALLDQDYSVVHIAGHGREDGSGVVLSGNLVLGGDLVKSMRRLPDLVFVNTCYSARQRVGQLPEQAASLARALIEAGVRCVVATGWAVDDAAAHQFAVEVYKQLLQQRKFVDAIASAREVTWRNHRGNNTWAAYQCYGDPDWVLKQRPRAGTNAGEGKTQAAAAASSGSTEMEARIVSAGGLLVALEALAVRGGEESKARAIRLEAEMDRQFGHLGGVAEAFAYTYQQLGMTPDAIRWYERAVRAEKGATFASLEQLFNLKVRSAANAVERAFVAWELTQGQADEGSAQATLAEAVDQAKAVFDSCAGELAGIMALPSSSERASLIGSAWKRKAMVAFAELRARPETSPAALLEMLDQSYEAYEKGANIAASEQRKNVGYPRLNALTVQLVRSLVSKQPLDVKAEQLAEVKASLDRWADEKQEFWPFVQSIEMDVYVAILARSLESKLSGIKQRFEDRFMRMPKPSNWDSVRNQARFLLRPYRALSSDAEEEAADALQRLLDGFAEARS